MKIEVGEIYERSGKFFMAVSEDQFVRFDDGIWKLATVKDGFKIKKVADVRKAAELLEVSMEEFNHMSEIFFRLSNIKAMNVSSKFLAPVRKPRGKFRG